jgi:hypothetical protein
MLLDFKTEADIEKFPADAGDELSDRPRRAAGAKDQPI